MTEQPQQPAPKVAGPTVKHGRYRLTQAFAKRVLNYYGRRIRKGVMPTDVYHELASRILFSRAVGEKTIGLVDSPKVGGYQDNPLPPKGEKGLHEAFKRIADYFALPEPPTPEFPEDKEEQKKQQQSQNGQGQGQPQDDQGKGDESGEGQGQGADQKDGEGQGNGGRDGQDEGDGQGQGDGDSKDGEKDSDKPGTGKNSKAKPSKAEKAGNGSTVATPTAAPPTPLLNLSAAAASIGRIIDHGKPLPTQEHPIQRLPDACYVDGPGFAPASSSWSYSERKIDTSNANQLTARLRAELTAISRHRVARDRDTGHVDTDTKLADLAGGVNLDRAFYSSTHARRINSAVQLIIDVSGSMFCAVNAEGDCYQPRLVQHANGNYTNYETAECKLPTAITCALLLAESLERLRVPVEVLAFTDSAWLVKSWNDKMVTARDRISRLAAFGGTNLPNAMESGLRSLASRREERHVQAVIIDGDIGYREQIKELSRKSPKLRTYCFGVGVEIPKGIFTRTVSKLTTKNMVETIVDQLKAALVPEHAS